MTGRRSRLIAFKSLAWTLPEVAALWWIANEYGSAWGIACATTLTIYIVYAQAAFTRSQALAFHLKEEAVLQAIMNRLQISREEVANAMLSYTTPESRAEIDRLFDDVGL